MRRGRKTVAELVVREKRKQIQALEGQILNARDRLVTMTCGWAEGRVEDADLRRQVVLHNQLYAQLLELES